MPRFHVTHARDGKFERRGLRSYLEYRDLGIKRATKGKVVAHVIRARPGKAPHGEWHRHACRLQFVYVLKGWALFEYEGVGKVLMKAGSCFFQPPRIRHRELAHSKNLELIEIVSPAGFRGLTSFRRMLPTSMMSVGMSRKLDGTRYAGVISSKSSLD